jgi:hypothetical protein
MAWYVAERSALMLVNSHPAVEGFQIGTLPGLCSRRDLERAMGPLEKPEQEVNFETEL